MTVKIILRQDVPNLGDAGEIKQVAPGYFRNYLLPRGMAIEATKGHINSLKSDKAIQTAQQQRGVARSTALADRLGAVTLRIPVRMGEQGRLYGSVTNKDIADALSAQVGVSIDRHDIHLDDPLKTVGVHEVPVKLDHGVTARLHVELASEEETAP